MKTAYAFSIVYREADGGMKHWLDHCWANNSQEARGIAHEKFDDQYPDCKQLSLLIREIVPDSDSTVTKTHEYQTPFIQPEFTAGCVQNYLHIFHHTKTQEPQNFNTPFIFNMSQVCYIGAQSLVGQLTKFHFFNVNSFNLSQTSGYS